MRSKSSTAVYNCGLCERVDSDSQIMIRQIKQEMSMHRNTGYIRGRSRSRGDAERIVSFRRPTNRA